MAELVGISEGHEYQHNATKNRKLNTRNPRKFKIAILFEQTTYYVVARVNCKKIASHVAKRSRGTFRNSFDTTDFSHVTFRRLKFLISRVSPSPSFGNHPAPILPLKMDTNGKTGAGIRPGDYKIGINRSDVRCGLDFVGSRGWRPAVEAIAPCGKQIRSRGFIEYRGGNLISTLPFIARDGPSNAGSRGFFRGDDGEV